MITSALTANIINEMHEYRSKFKLISYMDQVYMYQKPSYIEILNKHFNAIIAFTSYWKDTAYKIGIRKDMVACADGDLVEDAPTRCLAIAPDPPPLETGQVAVPLALSCRQA